MEVEEEVESSDDDDVVLVSSDDNEGDDVVDLPQLTGEQLERVKDYLNGQDLNEVGFFPSS